MQHERRKDRSDSRPEAATKLLEAVAHESGAQLLVAAGADGAVVSLAGTQDPAEMAALAGFGARAIGLWLHLAGELDAAGARTLWVDCADGAGFAGRFFRFGDIPLVAVARRRGGPVDPVQLDRVQSGFTRILEARDIRGKAWSGLSGTAGT